MASAIFYGSQTGAPRGQSQHEVRYYTAYSFYLKMNYLCFAGTVKHKLINHQVQTAISLFTSQWQHLFVASPGCVTHAVTPTG